ncbi:MAG TPA: dienelactone hydrolase family protein [Pusillimonas sp.]|uniref:dienelactone hydrolase family protein n=1 Tax=Pusillimonas sp. TaxID=3040095 RepID=UPI002C219065|nr:dienelactone hydrolase family protein [Pusillimonas sp.]HUH88831.1 dienelactone hydrolase family protein [Pusillimonas sp.]
MTRKKASDFHPDVLRLFDQYVHGDLDRRAFIQKAAVYAVGGVTAAALLESLRPNFAWANQVPESDPRISVSHRQFQSPQGSGSMSGYLATPAQANKKLPAVVVYHENRGLNPYIEDVARRLAAQGYLAFAPDALAPLGGYPGNEDDARALFAKLDQSKTQEDLFAAVDFVQNHPQFSGRYGAVGFCYGGTMVNKLAVRRPDLAAGVPFYGAQPGSEETARIKAPLLIHYAENDERINAGWPAFEQALKANKVEYQAHFYPGTQHGFHNDTTPRYDEKAAELAWTRTLEFLDKHLKG